MILGLVVTVRAILIFYNKQGSSSGFSVESTPTITNE
jgi:hypothetical protein